MQTCHSAASCVRRRAPPGTLVTMHKGVPCTHSPPCQYCSLTAMALACRSAPKRGPVRGLAPMPLVEPRMGCTKPTQLSRRNVLRGSSARPPMHTAAQPNASCSWAATLRKLSHRAVQPEHTTAGPTHKGAPLAQVRAVLRNLQAHADALAQQSLELTCSRGGTHRHLFNTDVNGPVRSTATRRPKHICALQSLILGDACHQPRLLPAHQAPRPVAAALPRNNSCSPCAQRVVRACC